MNQSVSPHEKQPPAYLSPLGAWALAFGCSVGRRYGRSVAVWVIMLALIIFSSTVWMLQETEKEIASTTSAETS